MRIGDPISAARKTLPNHGFSQLGGQARAVLLFAVSCCMSFPTCEAAPATDTTTAFALSVSTAIAELAESQVWTEKPDSDLLEERRNVLPFDRLLTFRAAAMVRYNVKGADFETLKKITSLRCRDLGVDLPGYFRKVLASTPSDWPFEPERDSGRPGNSGFLIYHRTHPDEAARLAGDLARALKGEHVDLKGRLGVDERDVEIEVEHAVLLHLYLKAFDSLTRQIYSARWIERFDYWLQEKLNFSYDAPRLSYVKNSAARDDFARLFYQCWDKYLSKPDEYALRERYICLRDLTLVAYNPHPTATDEAMRQKLGVEPEKWKAFQQFTKDVRAGLWKDRLHYPKER